MELLLGSGRRERYWNYQFLMQAAKTTFTMLPTGPSHIFPGALTNISFLSSCKPVSPMHEFRAVDNARRPFSDVLENSETIADLDNSIRIEHNLHPAEKKRRLTNEQVTSLEVSFETESKLEPERKIHLAQELGLQPRQVAIWFQNRRARSKSKQIEQEYETLKKQYDAVRSETDKLALEVARLRNLLDTQVASGWSLRSAYQEHETSLVTVHNPREYHPQQDHNILRSDNRTQSQAHYQRSPSVKSGLAISKQMNLHGEVDTSSDSDQTISLEARMWSEKEKCLSDKCHQHEEGKLSMADSRCSSQLLHHMAVKMEESFDLHNEIPLPHLYSCSFLAP